jgi:hypothetical protein
MAGARLPEFVVIGAVKAATTWIAHQLREHPDIYMPGPEPHYFSREFGRGDEWYAGLFAEAGPDQLIGEKSADYLAHPDAARRMAELLPDARLVAQLRNPIDRAYSDYCMLFRRGTVGGDPARYLARGGNADNARFLEDGLYARHLSRFLDHFPREQILIILYDDIKQAPARIAAEVFTHVGVTPVITLAALGARKNDSEAPLLPLGLRRMMRPLKRAVRPMRGIHWFERLRGTMARTPDYPPLTPELRAQLSDYYRNDVQMLGRLIGRDMEAWLSPQPALATAR